KTHEKENKNHNRARTKKESWEMEGDDQRCAKPEEGRTDEIYKERILKGRAGVGGIVEHETFSRREMRNLGHVIRHVAVARASAGIPPIGQPHEGIEVYIRIPDDQNDEQRAYDDRRGRR